MHYSPIPTIQAVVIAAPAALHHALATQALNAGKHCFVEKPLSLTYDEGAALVHLAEAKKKILFVGHILQYHPAVVRLKELINKGTIGRLQYIYSRRLSLGKIRREENILWSFAPHDISIILSLAGEEPSYVDSVGSNFLHARIADVTMTNLKFPSGIGAHIFVSWLNPFKEQKLVIVGSNGMLVFDDTEPIETEAGPLSPHHQLARRPARSPKGRSDRHRSQRYLGRTPEGRMQGLPHRHRNQHQTPHLRRRRPAGTENPGAQPTIPRTKGKVPYPSPGYLSFPRKQESRS